MAGAKQFLNVLKAYYMKKDAPFIANWIITSQCNCRCGFCELGSGKMYHPENEASTERAMEIVKELRAIGIKYLTLSGGEVFLRKDIFLVMKALGEAGIKVGIVSNGLMLNSLSEEKIGLLKKYLDTLVISIDSAVPEEHDTLRGVKGLFSQIMKGIDKLHSHGFTNITFESIIMGKNYKQVPEIIRLANKKGIRKVMFRPINIASNFPQLNPLSNKKEFAEYDVDDILKYMKLGLKTAKELKVDTDLTFNFRWISEYFRNLKSGKGFFHDRVMRNYFCFIPFVYVIINYNGGLLPCLLLKEQGNILKQSLKSERRKSDDVRQRLAKRQFYDICNCCFDQANNNVRFSMLCNPFLNIRSLSSLFRDVSSVRRRFNSKTR